MIYIQYIHFTHENKCCIVFITNKRSKEEVNQREYNQKNKYRCFASYGSVLYIHSYEQNISAAPFTDSRIDSWNHRHIYFIENKFDQAGLD